MTYNQLRNYMIAVLGLVGVVSITLFTGSIDYVNRTVTPIEMDGKTITFTCTDSIAGEDLVIVTDRCEYTDGLSHAIVYVAVANRSGVNQNVELMAAFKGSGKRIREISVLTNVTQNVYEPVYTEQCNDVESISSTTGKKVYSTTCVAIQTGTTTTQVTTPTWGPLPTTKRDVYEVAKEAGYLEGKTREQMVGFFAGDKSIAFPIKKNEVLYYKVHIEFPPQNRDQLYFEAVGSAGGYGFMI